MATLENCATKGIVHGDINVAFISEDTRFDLPVSKLGAKGKRNVLMYGLESLEDEGITCGSRFDAVREGGVD